MSEEIKYEPVFGPQELFNNEFEPNAIAVIFIDRTNKHHATSEAEIDRQLQRTGSYVVAMRRIIKTPVWTMEDKQAGRLPQIGSKYMAGSDKREFTCLFHGKGNGAVSIIGFNSDDEVSGYQIQYCHPIETPEERAQRLREEWKNNVIEIHHGKRRKMSTSTFLLDDIYDALLSGELKAPGVE